MRNKSKGVTLIELMTVVVVISILGAIAIPSYRNYLLRAQRSDGKTALLRIQSGLEKYLVQNGSYTTDLTSAPSATPGGLGLSAVSEQGFYALKVDLTPTGYIATAAAIAGKGQASDKRCQTFTVTETGGKGALDNSGGDRTTECWR